jgi:hypothetical protein
MRIKILFFILNFYSMSVAADYECLLNLYNSDETLLAVKRISVAHTQAISGDQGILYTEYQKGKKTKTTLNIRTVINGCEKEEEASFQVIRHTFERKKYNAEIVSEEFFLDGTSHLVGRFENYRLDIDCKIRPRL